MTNTMFKYWKLPDVVAVTVAIIIGFMYKPDGRILFLIGFTPMIINQIFFYSKLHKYSSENKLNIFGITRSRIITGAFSNLLFGVGIIFAFYYFELLNSETENSSNWVWISIFTSRMVESVIPYSYWNVIEMNNQLYIKKILGVKEIRILPEMTIRKITQEKIELNLENLTWELPIREEEIENFLTIIGKGNATNIN